jgi:MFS family permease
MAARRRIFHGWIVVATSALGLFFGAFPIAVSAFGVFFGSFAQQFHAGRAAVSLAFTIHNAITGALAVFVGRACDRYGARYVILPGLLLLGLVLLSAGMMGSSLWQLYLFYAALGAVAPATTSVPYGLVVSRWFDRRRGLALGLMMVGLGVGAVVMPPVAQQLIASFGWQAAFAVSGCAVLLIPIPIVGALLKETPEQVGLRADGAPPSRLPSTPGHAEGLSWSEIHRQGTFWLMVSAFALSAASVHACIIHMPELFTDRGSGARAAAMASSVVGIALLAGRIGCGYFLDRYFGARVATVVFALATLGIGLLWVGSTGAPALIAAFLVGLGMGAEVDIVAYLMGRYFGLRSLGSAFGFGFGAFVLAGGLGPLLMGIGFDRTGSYRSPLAGFFVASLAATVLIGRLGPYRYGVARDAREKTVA